MVILLVVVSVAIVSEIARKTFCLMLSAVDSFVPTPLFAQDVLKVGVAIVSEIARKTFCLMMSAVDSFVVLSLMLRPSFPSLRCYAFEPPVRQDPLHCSHHLFF